MSAKKSKVSEIREQIESLNNEIVKIQKNCKHPKKYKESKVVRFFGFWGIHCSDQEIIRHYCKKCELYWDEWLGDPDYAINELKSKLSLSKG